jgi:ElaB/YqjD/DUF883 family membrane-anchored ribosome-binding protein
MSHPRGVPKEGISMDDRRLASMGRHAPERVQELAGRTGAYMHERARGVSEQVERLTGRSMESWNRDASRYVREHPLRAIALTIGLGFVLGKILARD